MGPACDIRRTASPINLDQRLAVFRRQMDTAFHGLVSKGSWTVSTHTLRPSHFFAYTISTALRSTRGAI